MNDKLPNNLCRMPVELICNEDCFCEYMTWKDDLPICVAPNPPDDCPDFAYYLNGCDI